MAYRVPDPSFASLTGKPTTLSGYGITDAQGLDAGLTSLEAADSAAGIAYPNAADIWTRLAVAAGDLITASSASALAVVPAGILGAPLRGGGAGVAPVYSPTMWSFEPVEQAWSTGVGVTVETGIPAVNGDYRLIIQSWVEAVTGGVLRVDGEWRIILRRTAGTLAILSSGSTLYGNAGGGAPAQAWTISGDDLILTVTSAGRAGRTSQQVNGTSLGDLTT